VIRDRKKFNIHLKFKLLVTKI